MLRFYKLNKDGSIQLADDLEEAFLERTSNQLGDSTYGPFRISTVFLGLDRNYSGKGLPVLFETMVFDNRSEGCTDLHCSRCCTYEEAEKMHFDTIKWVIKNYDRLLKESMLL
jgi:hypothetical protein